MVNKIAITIGIPAYNEAGGIKRLLESIQKQSSRNFSLVELVVISDGSNDTTVTEALSSKIPTLKVVNGRKRLGKRKRLNNIFKNFKGEVLVLLDADITFSNNFVLEEIIKKFQSSEKVMLVSANSYPSAPSAFTDHAIFSAINVYLFSRDKIKEGNNIYGCTGACLGLRRMFAQNIQIPDIISDDDYLYLICISKGYEFKYAKNAKVEYRLPKNIKDYVRQVFRSTPRATKQDMGKIFGKLLQSEFTRPKRIVFIGIAKALLENPVGVLYISIVRLACLPFYRYYSSNFKLDWFTAKSTRI